MYAFWATSINGLNRERVNFQNMHNFSKDVRMDGLIWSLNLLRKRPGKSKSVLRWRKVRDRLSPMWNSHRGVGAVCGVCVHMSKYLLDRSDQGSNHCAGDRIASDLRVCLLNAPLGQHEKERSLLLPHVGLCFAQMWKEWCPSFRMKHETDFWGKGNPTARQVLEER